MKSFLPIDSLLPDCAKLLEAHSTLILQATPGSGKTTRLPPFLLDSPAIKNDSQIWVLQPRRLAAKFAATRVAEEENVPLGDLVGYHFRFEKNSSSRTRLLYLTEGMLMRRLVREPNLPGVSMVILDEFHERHLHTDLALSFLRHLQNSRRPDLKIVVMSATLELEQLKTYLPQAPIKQLETPLFPVEIKYLSQYKIDKPLRSLVSESIQTQFASSENGDILVFLPGMKEIRDCEKALEVLSKRFNFSVFVLHGDIPKELQEKALQSHSRRKVILSTNIAETSLTIPGINCVIDSGLQRIASYSWWTGVPLLSTKTVPKSSAIQRSGRAGRTGPGVCYRLYTQHDFDTRPAFEVPEIRRSDLAQTLLELKALGISKLSEFPWFESPPINSIHASQRLLFQLGALDCLADESKLTPLGEELKNSSLHPRLSRFLNLCEKRGCLREGIKMAALISEGKLDSLDALEMLNRPLDFQTEKLKNQIEKDFVVPQSNVSQTPLEQTETLAFCLLSSFPDRVAQARMSQKIRPGQADASVEFTLASGGTAQLNSERDFFIDEKEPYFIALDIQEFKRNQNTSIALRSLVPIKENWLYEVEPCPLEESEVCVWQNDKLNSYSQIRLGQLVLENKERPLKSESFAFNVIIKEFFKTSPEKIELFSLNDWAVLFKTIFPDNEIESLIVRVGLLNRHLNLGNEIYSTNIINFLKQWLHRKRSRNEISDPECLDAFKQYFCAGQEHVLEKKVPSHLILPSQRKAAVHYQLDKGPWIESRMQDFFGLTQAPAICDGKVPLTLHLLAPNYRAVQVTTDLKNFWETHYPTLRKELSRNYPKHAWPENPRVPLAIARKK